MSHISDFLRKRERVTITLPILLEYYITSKQLKGCSKKTRIGTRSNMGRFIRFLQSRGNSLKLVDLSLQDARAYVAYLQGNVNKYEGHKFTHPHPDSTYSPVTIHSHIRTLRAFSS